MTRLAGVATLALVTALPVASWQGVTPPRSGAEVEGRVVDADMGRPLANVLVSARASTSSRTSFAVLTSGDGRFRLTGLPPGNWQVIASKADYFDSGYGKERPRGSVATFYLANGQRVGEMVIRMWAPGYISGRAVDDQNEPIVGATVRAYPTQVLRFESSAQPSIGGTGTTDDRGDFEIRVLPGEYAVAVPVMHLTGPIGTYADRGGGMIVFDRPPRGLPVLSSEDGRFHLRLGNGLTPTPLDDGRPGTFVTTFHPGATTLSAASMIRVAAGETHTGADIRVVRQPRIRIDGIAAGPSGPLKQVVLRLTPRDWPAPLGETISSRSGTQLELGAPQVTTHDDGRFTFMSALAGDYTLTAYRQLRDADVILPDEDGFWATMPITVGDRDRSDLVVTMKPGFSVGGHYEIEGTTSPSSQLSVLLQRVPGEGSSGSYRNAGPGRFILKGVHPGRYVIRAYVPTGWYLKSATHAGQDVADEPFEISSDITDLVVTIANRAAQVTGVITRSDGTPAPEAAVVLFPVEQARRIWSRAPRLLQQVRPGPDGQYVIRGLPAGEYFLATVRESQMDAWPDPKFLDSLARTAVRLLLADGEARSVPLTLGAGR